MLADSILATRAASRCVPTLSSGLDSFYVSLRHPSLPESDHTLRESRVCSLCIPDDTIRSLLFLLCVDLVSLPVNNIVAHLPLRIYNVIPNHLLKGVQLPFWVLYATLPNCCHPAGGKEMWIPICYCCFGWQIESMIFDVGRRVIFITIEVSCSVPTVIKIPCAVQNTNRHLCRGTPLY